MSETSKKQPVPNTEKRGIFESNEGGTFKYKPVTPPPPPPKKDK